MVVNPPTPAQIAWVFEKLLRIRRRGGTLRALVCKGFGLENDRFAYGQLEKAGGVELCKILSEERKRLRASHEAREAGTKHTKLNASN